ncbi:MAG: hypothetical protein CMG64_05145 [Candidatus Marinimicrobia bacterium]|nr:hypothetical protein [Candidatus Neomarinimicrobiota bacterium]
MYLMLKEPKNYIFFLLFVVFAFLISYSSLLSIKINCNDIKDYIEIPNDASSNKVGKIFEDELCLNPYLFKFGIISTFNQRNIKAGRYNLKGVSNLRELIEIITSVNSDRIRFTIIEGWDIKDIAYQLNNKMGISSSKFIKLCNSPGFIGSLGFINIPSLEGYLFPDTYILLDSYIAEDIIKIFVSRFKDVYNTLNYNGKLNFSTHEIVTLGSIIQAEGMYTDEMPTISSVYHNRLNRNMKLEADPTVLYFMTDSDRELFKTKRRIFRKYKNRENPYNTYLNKGLPVGPINNPGFSALESAISPLKTNYLYFVADGKGRHIFSKTLAAHKRAIKYGSK